MNRGVAAPGARRVKLGHFISFTEKVREWLKGFAEMIALDPHDSDAPWSCGIMQKCMDHIFERSAKEMSFIDADGMAGASHREKILCRVDGCCGNRDTGVGGDGVWLVASVLAWVDDEKLQVTRLIGLSGSNEPGSLPGKHGATDDVKV